MILSQPEIREAVKSGEIKFDPPLEESQWGEASINLRLGNKFTKLKNAKGFTFCMAKGGIAAIAESGLWHEDEIPIEPDGFGKRHGYRLESREFILALTYEHIWMPRNLIGMVEGRSSYARTGLSMHQTAPWIQPGWDGHITLEIHNNGPWEVELMPVDDKPCQLTFHQLTSELEEELAYGSRKTDVFQSQTSALPKATN
jgi:dCTP deaminase